MICGGHVSEQARLAVLLTEGIAGHKVPRWTPDGSEIAFYIDSSSYGIYFVNAGGTTIRRLDNQKDSCRDPWAHDLNPDIASDGSRIVYSTLRHTAVRERTPRDALAFPTVEVVTAKLDGSDYHRITDRLSLDFNPVWSPDGTLIAFLSKLRDTDTPGYRLYTMTALGGYVKNIAPSVEATGDPPVWSPDGRLLAFAGMEPDLSGTDEWTKAVFVVDPHGKDIQRMGDTLGPPVWSPQGNRIALPQSQDGTIGIVILDLEGEEQFRFLSAYPYNGFPSPANLAWSPDGSAIAVQLPFGPDEQSGPLPKDVVLFSIAPDGSNLTPLVLEGSPDGPVLVPAN